MAYVVISAVNDRKKNKGEVLYVSDVPSFGRMVRLPQCLRLEISGATAAGVRDYQDIPVHLLVTYSIVAENAAGWRVRMELDPAVIAITGMDAEFKQAIKDYILNDPHEGNWTAVQQSQTRTSMTVDIAKGQLYDLQQIRNDVSHFFIDRLEQSTGFRRYRFPDAQVDAAVISGTLLEAANEDAEGNIPDDLVHTSITKAQTLAIIIDRLA